MRTIIGIDVGGSTTKIVAAKNNTLLNPILVSANDPITSIYGAFGKFTNENSLELSDVDKVVITGVGASYVDTLPWRLSPVRRKPWARWRPGWREPCGSASRRLWRDRR